MSFPRFRALRAVNKDRNLVAGDQELDSHYSFALLSYSCKWFIFSLADRFAFPRISQKRASGPGWTGLEVNSHPSRAL